MAVTTMDYRGLVTEAMKSAVGKLGTGDMLYIKGFGRGDFIPAFAKKLRRACSIQERDGFSDEFLPGICWYGLKRGH